MHFAPLVVIVRVVLLRSSWRSFMRAAPSIMRASNSSLVFTFFLYTSHRSSTRQFQTAVSSHPLTIGHMFIWTFLLRIIDNTTSQNIYYSSWNTLYNKGIEVIYTWPCYHVYMWGTNNIKADFSRYIKRTIPLGNYIYPSEIGNFTSSCCELCSRVKSSG
jgi:hypothetical protein